MKEEKPIILVVEDETDVLRINARMLTRRGYTVYTAENCRQAYERMEAPTPDLLILDIMLPDGSGYDICERFRSTSDHPVIFLTRIVKGSLVLDIPKFKATVNGTDAELTAKEFALLLLLVQSENKEVPPHELYEKVWGTPSGEDIRTIRFHIKNLRRKIHADDANDYDIVSVYGKGYMFTTVC